MDFDSFMAKHQTVFFVNSGKGHFLRSCHIFPSEVLQLAYGMELECTACHASRLCNVSFWSANAHLWIYPTSHSENTSRCCGTKTKHQSPNFAAAAFSSALLRIPLNT